MIDSASFGVNGRFLTQPITGVQRYAWNVCSAMNASLLNSGARASIIAPTSAQDPGFAAMPLIEAKPFSGQLWEQSVLPARWQGRLLNLGNLGPVSKSDQVICIHDANVFVKPESYGLSFRLVYSALQRLLTRRAARITTVSADSARQIARFLPIRAEEIAVLPNGHEHALAWDPTLAQRARLAISDQRDFVLALGSRARHKNIQLLMRIAPEIEAMGLDLVIAGGGSGIFAEEALPSLPNVKMIGQVTDHDLAYLMDHAFCLAFPSWTEGFGLPIVEAMARKCPVISSDRASLPEVCGNAALMAAPDDPTAWIRHLRQLVASSQLRQELIARGSARISLFSWKKTAAGYLELMRDPKTSFPVNLAQTQLPKIAVVIATLGRPAIVSATLSYLLKTQSCTPAIVIVSCITPEDAGDAADLPTVKIVTGRAGLPAQRNAALAALPPGIDVVAFFDDDFVADASWLAAAAQTFRDEPEVVAFTGRVLADGIKGPGLSFDEAVRIVESFDHRSDWSCIEPYSPYGCNMAFRLAAIRELAFDERLVLYGWLEDRDFGGALSKRGGRLIKSASACGVHMGIKSGRVAGDRLGYSQVVNPIYLLRKGTMSLGQVASHLFRNISTNVARSIYPEPFIDRRGRLLGNIRGLADLLRGHVEPDRAATLRRRNR
ncbi:glycosyltransferase [Bradyrhizobium sp. 76]|uniref:glycosyltransferase n=1 Tax=Bradyrhizobium sp. 76 TaxID=2782680 RepID=UPI001FF7528F|nr:glycosyltransferase [Bradyrhizobium sp. 76]MCK1404971.1 glycosyltransferase [Bradyrhizobium sp. 76]